jgi:hypothetical protein
MQSHMGEKNSNGQTSSTDHSTSQTNGSAGAKQVEFIDSIELARRWNACFVGPRPGAVTRPRSLATYQLRQIRSLSVG